MRYAALPLFLAMAGCAMTPEQMMGRTDWDVCRLSMTPAQGQVASYEAQRRGLDCRPYYPAIQMQQANENAAIQNYLNATKPAPATTTNCVTQRVGDTLRTVCR